jgi:hypothetical protein
MQFPHKFNMLGSDVANAIDGVISASLNNKFAAVSENFGKLLVTHMDQIESMFCKLFGNNIYASTSSVEKKFVLVLVMTSQICKS